MINKGRHQEIIFREVQRMKQIWVLVLVLSIAILMWYGFVQQIILGVPFGDKPAPDIVYIVIWVIFGIIFPVFFLGILRLIVEVRHDGIYIRFAPYHRHFRKIIFTDITHYEAITYNSFKRFWGWGIRVNEKGEKLYNVSGNKGIELHVESCEKSNIIVIGTQKPDEFRRAIESKFTS